MRRVAAVLIGTGVLIWALGVAAWIAGVWVTLPPDAVRVLALSLALLAGGVLLAAGAVLGRAVRRSNSADAPVAAAPPVGSPRVR